MTRAWKEPPGEWIDDRDEPEDPLAFWRGLICWTIPLGATFFLIAGWAIWRLFK